MKTTSKNTRHTVVDEFPGYPYYPDSDDIYNNEIEVKDLEPTDIDKMYRNIDEEGLHTYSKRTTHQLDDIVSRE